MDVTGKLYFGSCSYGTSRKTGKPYYIAKFRDPQAEEYVSFFIEEPLFHVLENLPKDSPVVLTLNLSINRKYFKLESVEPIETR